jgi:hypothetical protein
MLPAWATGGTDVLYVDVNKVAKNSMDHTRPIMFPGDETFDVGQCHPHRGGTGGISVRCSVNGRPDREREAVSSVRK